MGLSRRGPSRALRGTALLLSLLTALSLLRALLMTAPTATSSRADAPDPAPVGAQWTMAQAALTRAPAGQLAAPPAPLPLPAFYAPAFVPSGAHARRLWRTAATQAAIHSAQNPADCGAATYLRLQPVASGVGSNIHTVTAYLALAMNRGEVLVLHSEYGGDWVRGAYCDAARARSYECFFEPLSGCAPDGEPPPGATVLDVGSEDVVHQIPVAWHDAFKASAGDAAPDTPTRDVKYWWRAQGAAYVMRLNARTAAELGARRRALASPAGGATPVPLPLPEGTYAVHVRHGDKSEEMRLFGFDKFARAITAARNSSGVNSLPPLTLFVSTEDPAVIDDALALAAASPGAWRVLHAPWGRDNAATLDAASKRGADETLNALLNLWTALEATHFVGQLGSNWCRLMDELRRVWLGDRPGCCTPYVEAGCDADSCPVETLNWR
jgi:hypothetical protein